jgi:hypothetical protein
MGSRKRLSHFTYPNTPDWELCGEELSERWFHSPIHELRQM